MIGKVISTIYVVLSLLCIFFGVGIIVSGFEYVRIDYLYTVIISLLIVSPLRIWIGLFNN